MEDFGKQAYDAYGEAVGWKSEKGEMLQEWSDLSKKVQLAWQGAAQAVMLKTLADDKRARVEAESFLAPITTI